jgi:hypothetical protein
MTKPIDDKVLLVLRIGDQLHQIRYLAKLACELTQGFPFEYLHQSRIEVTRLRMILIDLLATTNYDKTLSKI